MYDAPLHHSTRDSLEYCVEQGWMRRVGEDRYQLTEEGHAKAAVELRTDPNAARNWIAFFYNDPGPNELARRRVRSAVLEFFPLIDPKDLPSDWYVKLADKVLAEDRSYRLATSLLLEMAELDDGMALRIAGALDTVGDKELS